jgi:hypothetical protein
MKIEHRLAPDIEGHEIPIAMCVIQVMRLHRTRFTLADAGCEINDFHFAARGDSFLQNEEYGRIRHQVRGTAKE